MRAQNTGRRIVLTGASRGLGLEFARQWLRAGHDVMALARRPEGANELSALADEYGERLVLHACDVASDSSVDDARAAVERTWGAVDLLVNNAGIASFRGAIDDVDLAEMAEVLEVNAIGPVRMTKAFLPLLERGRAPAVVHITSRMGSIADNGSGGAYAYRMSKAALNMACRNMMYDLERRGIVTYVIHPGWVRTEMGGANATLGIPEAVEAVIATVEGLRPEQSGGFFDLRGERLPW